MSQVTSAEQLAQMALDVNVLSERELQSVWSELGTRNVSLEDFSNLLQRKNLLTNYQVDRLMRGLKTGFIYGDYKILYLVGSGTFARVFRAVNQKTGKIHAVKVLRASKSNDPKEAELFRREGELGASLVHENIVPIHQVVSRPGEHYIVMDFVEGRNLREFYKIRRKFDPLEAAEIIAGMVAGLHYAFQKGVTHRDLKMSNVLVSSTGKAMLVDFGLAALEAESGGDAKNERAIDYAGLERSTGLRKDDDRSDIFFAGCIFYQMVSGKPPLSETRDRMQRLAKTRYQNIPPIISAAPDLPLPLARVIGKATEFDPDKRYQTPGDMLTDLKVSIRRVKTGGDSKKQELASREGIDEQGNARRIMIIESLVERQNLLRDLFKRNGYRVLVASDPDKAIDRFFDASSAADLALFCSSELGAEAVEGFNRFGKDASTRDVPAVLLLEETHAAWAEAACTANHRAVAIMPIKLRQLREMVLGVLGVEAI